MNKKIRIGLIIGQLLKGGGAEKQVLAIAEGLDKTLFDPTVISLTQIHSLPSDRPQSFKLLSLKRRFVLDPIRFAHLVRIFREERFDLIHSFLLSDNFYACVAARLTGIRKVITSSRSCWSDPNILTRGRDTLIYALSDLIIVNSRAGIKFMHDFYKSRDEKIRLLYNGVEDVLQESKSGILRRELKLDGCSILCSVGRLDEGKDHGMIISIMPDIIKSFPAVRLVIIGTGPLYAKLRNQIHDLNLDDFVFLIGARGNVYEHLIDSDIFILVSRYEGLPNVILEAMSAAKPVIATAVGGCPEIVRDGYNGFLININDPGALKDKICTLLEDNSLRAKMGEAGRRLAREEFSMKKMVETAEEIYTGLVA